MIDAYLELEEKKEAEKAEWQKLAKEKGIYEVDKILNVEIHHGVRESLKTCSGKSEQFCDSLDRNASSTFAGRAGVPRETPWSRRITWTVPT